MSAPRGDLSDQLIHLTRGTPERVEANFLAILEEGVLKGSDTCIKGVYKCVCFSEAPISVIAHMIAREDARYAPFGVLLGKEWLFEQGGRPAIYQADDEFELLRSEQRYRHVRYEPPHIDWTWEREWRCQATR